MTTACRKAFTSEILELAKQNEDIIVVTSDARGSVTLTDYANELPHQFIEMGIAEQNEIGVAAGLALSGKKPFVCAPACFLSARCLEQIKIDIAYSKANVKLFGVSGGVSYGALGYSHHSLHDIAVMRALTGIDVLLPCDGYEMKQLTKELITYPNPVYIRVGRNPVSDVYNEIDEDFEFKIGKANTIKEGNDIAIISAGELLKHAYDAAIIMQSKGVNARVIDMHTIKPLDEEVVLAAAEDTRKIVTIEEHSIYGGLGSAISELLSQKNPVKMKIMGFPDENIVSGTSKEVFKHYGLEAEQIAHTILEDFF